VRGLTEEATGLAALSILVALNDQPQIAHLGFMIWLEPLSPCLWFENEFHGDLPL
jgi:hypothetical protein